MEKDVKIEVKEMPELNVAYIQHIGPYNLFSAHLIKLKIDLFLIEKNDV